MLRRFGLALALCSLTATAAMAGTVYKWSDREGQVHYTDRPPRGADAKILAIIQEDTGVADEDGEESSSGSGDDASSDAGNDGGGDADDTAGANAAMKKEVEADLAKTRGEQCKEAKDRYQKYIESQRIYRDKGGKREYLDEKELDQARLRARADVDAYCGK